MNILVNTATIAGLLGILYLESIAVHIMWDKIDNWAERRKQAGLKMLSKKGR